MTRNNKYQKQSLDNILKEKIKRDCRIDPFPVNSRKTLEIEREVHKRLKKRENPINFLSVN